MEEIRHVNDEELEVELSQAEKDLDKILSVERNQIDLLNENLKLKKVLRSAKVGMWKKYEELAEKKKEKEKEVEEMQKKNGKKGNGRRTGGRQQETFRRNRRTDERKERVQRQHAGVDGQVVRS